MRVNYHLAYWRKTQWHQGWCGHGNYEKPSAVRSAISELRCKGIDRFHILKATSEVITPEQLEEILDPEAKEVSVDVS